MNEYYNQARPELMALVPENAHRILDIGCGAGALGKAIKLRQDAYIVGMEINQEAASIAEQVLDEVICCDAEKSQHLNLGKFDCIILADVLEHLRNPQAILEHCKTMLRSDGIIIISVPNSRHWTVINGLIRGDYSYEAAGLRDETHLRLFTRRELQKLLTKTGYGLQQLIGIKIPNENPPEYGTEVNVGKLHVSCESREELEEFYTYQYFAVAKPRQIPDYGKISIIIPCWNQMGYTMQCLDSLFPTIEYLDVEVILINNGSDDGTKDYLDSIQRENVRVIHNEENTGYVKAINQGIAAATGKTIITLNNDTILVTNWLEPLIHVLWNVEKCGIVGPVSNNVSGPQKIPVGYQHLYELDGWAFDEQIKRKEEIYQANRLVGFCMAIRRECIDEIGVLDEVFGMGFGDDDDITLRAIQAGWKTLFYGGSFVHHFGSVSFRQLPDCNELLQKNIAILQEKYAQKEQ